MQRDTATAVVRLMGLAVCVWAATTLTTGVLTYIGFDEATRQLGSRAGRLGSVSSGIGYTLILAPILHSVIGMILIAIAPTFGSMVAKETKAKEVGVGRRSRRTPPPPRT